MIVAVQWAVVTYADPRSAVFWVALAVPALLLATVRPSGVSPVVGRAYGHPEQMKPNPRLLAIALHVSSQPPHMAVFVGDSLTDIDAARAAGIACIAVANKPGKDVAFRSAGVPVVNK
jgi:phosphoglycolate phosphatase-like HAD superfamily hydrolase